MKRNSRAVIAAKNLEFIGKIFATVLLPKNDSIEKIPIAIILSIS